ncbi:hypothetical protein ACFU42_21425, partial [Bacillus velezensis]
RNTQVWLKGSVLKTDRGVKARGGSNPSSSAILILNLMKLEHILEIVLSAACDAADFLYAKKSDFLCSGENRFAIFICFCFR